MSETGRARRGVVELRALLEARTTDLRELDLAGFRAWLDDHLGHWRADPVFAAQWSIRELRRAHPEVAALEAELRRAVAADAASPAFPRLQVVERGLTGAARAVAGLTGALAAAPPTRREALREKLRAARAREGELREESAALLRASPERRRMLALTARMDELRRGTGLHAQEARLAGLLTDAGRRSGSAGSAFEEVALEVSRREIASEAAMGESPRILHGVTLGAARTELDQLLVRPRGAGEPVEVLGMVEVKSNPNDLAGGFRQRQENLAWLTGDSAGYDPAQYRTRRFPSGHFDRPAVHRQDEEEVVLDRGSFAAFRRDPATGFFLDRLFFVTRPGPLWGASAATVSRIRHRVATDERWEPGSDSPLAALLEWCRSLTNPLETPDVLRLYASTPEHARQILLVDR